MPGLHRPLEDRFLDKLVLGVPGGHWLWGAHISPEGYGRIGRGGAAEGIAFAHRVAYELYVGPIPDGTEIDHVCRVRSCVRPAHLEAVPHLENVRRGQGSAATAARHSERTHCKNGHKFTPENTIDGGPHYGRRCRECSKARSRQAYLRKKGQKP